MRFNGLLVCTSKRAASRAWFCTDAPHTHRWVNRLNRENAVEKAVSKARAIAQKEEVAHAARGRYAPVIAQRITKVPQVQPPQELFNSSMKAVRRVRPRTDLRSEHEVAKNLAARIMDTLMKEVSSRLKSSMSKFPTFEHLHPFEQSVLDLAVGAHNYRRILANTEVLRKKAVKVAKQYAVQASGASSPKQAEAVSDEGTKAVEACLLTEGKGSMWELHELAKKMRKVPQMDTAVPMVALIGAPNVGKSSLVHVLSSGTPEVCNYPFTTRSIKMGHFYVDGVRHQVTDTPGLLYREDEERNSMELLTVATLEHLPTAALFIMDLTEGCGCSCQQQWQIRTELLTRFPHKLWIDIITKVDLLEEEIYMAGEIEASQPSMGKLPKDAVEMIQWLPHAIKVSSVTEEGIADLQQAVLDLMKSDSWAAQVDRMYTRDADELNYGKELVTEAEAMS